MLPLGNWMVQCPMALTSLLRSLIYQYCTSLCFLPPLHLFLLSILSKCYTLLLTSASRRDGGEVQVKSRNLRQFWGTSDAVLNGSLPFRVPWAAPMSRRGPLQIWTLGACLLHSASNVGRNIQLFSLDPEGFFFFPSVILRFKRILCYFALINGLYLVALLEFSVAW